MPESKNGRGALAAGGLAAILASTCCLGPLVLVVVVLLMFQLVFTVADPFMGWIEAAQDWVSGGVAAMTAEGAWRSFLVDGIVNGVGSDQLTMSVAGKVYAIVYCNEMDDETMRTLVWGKVQ